MRFFHPTPGSRESTRMLLRFMAACFSVLLVACSEPVTVASLPPDATILAFGNSVTRGTGAGKNEDYPQTLSTITGMAVVNAGIPGDTASRARERIQPVLDRVNPDLVIVELGGNDFLARRPPDQVKADLKEIIQAIQQRQIPVVLVAVPEFSAFRATIGTLKDSPIYKDLGEELGIPVIENLFAGILSNEALRADPIHPNAKGYLQLAQGIYRALVETGFIPESN